MDATEKKKLKSVRFQEEVTQTVTPVTSLDQKKDIAIFTGYCILKNVMDAILFCLECPDKRLTQPVLQTGRRIISSRTMSGSGSDLDISRSASMVSHGESTDTLKQEDSQKDKPDKTPQTMYDQHVTTILQQTQTYLAKLQPLTLRVELLENIFSLLFLTHEDIQEAMLISEYDSDVGDDSKSVRSMSTGGVTPGSARLTLSEEVKQSEVSRQLEMTTLTPLVTNDASMDYDIPFQEKSSVADDKKGIDMNKVGEALEHMKSNIRKKRRIFSDDGHIDGRHSSISENISSMSTSSSVNLDSHGFVVNIYLVRDILAMLKTCVIDVSAARYHIHGNKADVRERYRAPRDTSIKGSRDIDPGIEEPLCHLVRSSITVDILQKRIAQLERFTSEAHWRYQLVADEHIPKSPGQVLQEVLVSTGGSSDDEVEIMGLGTSGHHKKRKRTGRIEVKIYHMTTHTIFYLSR